MPPAIDVSPEVLARLRALAGGRGADDVLRLLLGLPDAAAADGTGADAPGFEDATYGVRFPQGFEIFRAYKGRAFRARAEAGRWRLDADGNTYDSLNQLSQAVIDGNENAWMFWHYRGADGRPRRIAELRDPAKVQRRPRRHRPAATATATALRPPPMPAQPEPVAAPPSAPAAVAPPPAGMAWEPRPATLVLTRPKRR